MNTPNLIVMGAMKCGTTSLHDYLDRHPDVFMSKKKELDFFVKEINYEKGWDWYKSNFPTESIIRGESSQNYSKFHFWEGVPERIYKHLGDGVKFIYIIRNPIDRVYSHYTEMLAQNVAPKSLEHYLLEGGLAYNEIVLSSCYYQQMRAFLEYYPLESIKIVTLDRLKTDRLSTMNEMFNFLELSKVMDNALFDFIKNDGKNKYSDSRIAMYLYNSPLYKKISKYASKSLKDKLKTNAISRTILFRKVPVDRALLSPRVIQDLKTIFLDDIKKLNALTGENFNHLLDK